jgi:predicted alpha/beta-fold hydrolase
LQAKDDPFMSEDVIPSPEELSDCVKLEVTDTGGHVGFVTGNFPWTAEYWLEQRAPQFLQQYFKKVK